MRLRIPGRVAWPLWGLAMLLAATAIALRAANHGVHSELFHLDLGLKREEFEQYVAGATRASALRLTDIDRLWAPVSLAHLRHAQPFNPPQSYRYLTCDALERLVQGHPVASELRRFRERASPLPQGQARSR